MFLSIGEASNMMGVSISTLRRWDHQGTFTSEWRTTGGHRRYSLTKIKEFLGDIINSSKRKIVAYARVSSHDQKDDLKRQIKKLDQHCQKETANYEVIDDLGSGMNYKKRGLKKLLRMILSGQVSKIIMTHKDRLLRFGSELIFTICNFFGVEIEIMEENKKRSDEEALAYDVLEIITVFAARLYGRRSHQNSKLSSGLNSIPVS